MDITFRPITDDDMPFLQELYGTTREDELALVDWTQIEKDNFVAFQFNAQHTYYQENYRDAEFSIILLDGQPGGRVYVDRREDEHRIVDIALMPDQRGQGTGGRIMKDLLDEAADAGKIVRIHVEHDNPAMHLYERLGFKKIGDTEVYFLMEWNPPED